jgi:pimeloyl-ACP methyl ester carboxylesterase
MSGTPAHVFQAMGEGVLAFDSLAAALRCPVPGLLVLAARPSFLDTTALASLPDSWQVARVVGSGHFVQLVVPDQVNAMIDRFLELLSTDGND